MRLKGKQRGFWNFVVPAAASVVGGLLSSRSRDKATSSAESVQESNVAAQERMNEANLAAQKEFAQHGIRWKVQDAKAAGLHPLFGAGLSGSSFSPSFQASQRQPTRTAEDYSWLASLGQLLGNFLGPEAAKSQQAVAAQQSGHESMTITEHPGGGRTISYPIKGLESQLSGTPMTDWSYGHPDGSFRHYSANRELSDPRLKSHVSNVEDAAFWQRFSFGPKFSVILPKTSEPQEVFEDKPLWFWAMVAKANVKEYGPGWLTQARQQFPSLREVWKGVVQELESSGILPSIRSQVPDIFRR